MKRRRQFSTVRGQKVLGNPSFLFVHTRIQILSDDERAYHLVTAHLDTYSDILRRTCRKGKVPVPFFYEGQRIGTSPLRSVVCQ